MNISLHSQTFSRLLFSFLILAVLSLFVTGVAASPVPERIVSLAPSSTEILFELGLGDRIVGVTRYCDYPEAAKKITKVGGYVDPNYEAIVALRPDLVLLLDTHTDVQDKLTKLSVPVLMVPYKTVDDIHGAILKIGEACGATEKAAALVKRMEARKQAVCEAVKDGRKPRVMICIGRDTGAAQLSGIYIAGRNGYYDELVEMAGGENVYRDEGIAYPQVSAEGVIQMDPDVILELANFNNQNKDKEKEIVAQWNVLKTVTAVREKRVHVIAGSYAMRPVPRYVRFLEELARLLHPESFREDDPVE